MWVWWDSREAEALSPSQGVSLIIKTITIIITNMFSVRDIFTDISGKSKSGNIPEELKHTRKHKLHEQFNNQYIF